MPNTPATSIEWQPGITLLEGDFYHLDYGARVVALANGVAGAAFDAAEYAKFTSYYTGGLVPSAWKGRFFYEWQPGRTYPQGAIVARDEERFVALGLFHESTGDFDADVAAGHWGPLSAHPNYATTPPQAPAPPSTAGVTTPHTPPTARFPVADETARDLITGQAVGDLAVLASPDRTDTWNGTKWVPGGGGAAQTLTVPATAHGLPPVPADPGFVPVYLDATGVHLAQSVDGRWATAVATDTSNPNEVGLAYGGLIATPGSTLAQRRTLFTGATLGAVDAPATPPVAPYQAIGEVQDATNTLIRIHQPVGDASAGAKRETVVLPSLAAGAWTAFPPAAVVSEYSEYEIYDGQNNITRALSVRRNAGNLEVFSLIAKTNLSFEYTGT